MDFTFTFHGVSDEKKLAFFKTCYNLILTEIWINSQQENFIGYAD